MRVVSQAFMQNENALLIKRYNEALPGNDINTPRGPQRETGGTESREQDAKSLSHVVPSKFQSMMQAEENLQRVRREQGNSEGPIQGEAGARMV